MNSQTERRGNNHKDIMRHAERDGHASIETLSEVTAGLSKGYKTAIRNMFR